MQAGPSLAIPPKQKFPRLVYYALMATLVMFLAANTFGSTITSVINATKWGPLVVLGVLALGALKGRRTPEFPPIVLIWIVVFALVSLISAYVSFIGAASFASLLTVALVVLTGYAVAALVVATDSRRMFFDLIGMLGRIMVGGALLFFIAGVDLGRGGGFAAWVDNPNTLASMMAPGCVVFMAGCLERRPGWQYWHLPFLLLSIPLIIVTEGRASYVWVLVSALSFWVYRRGSWPAAFVLMIGLIVLIGFWEPIKDAFMHWAQLDIAPQRASEIGPLSGREEVWRVGSELSAAKPLFGYGPGSSTPLIMSEQFRFVRFQGAHFHSSYIMALVETGWLGLVALLGVLISTIVSGLVDSKRKRVLPRESWPTAALPFAMFMGALGHALFESWLIAGGNVNAPLFWTLVWLIHFQAQVPIRAVRRNPANTADPRRRPATARA